MLPFLLLFLSSPSSASSSFSFFSYSSSSSFSFSSSFYFYFSSSLSSPLSPLSSCKQLSLIAATHMYMTLGPFHIACGAYQWPTLKMNEPSLHQISTADRSLVMDRTQTIPHKFMQRFWAWSWADLFQEHSYIYEHSLHLSILCVYTPFASSSLVFTVSCSMYICDKYVSFRHEYWESSLISST